MLSLLLLATTPQEPTWSKPVAGLRARIEVEQKGKKDGSPKLSTYLTLQNITDSFGTVDVYLSLHNLDLWLEDAAGKRLESHPGGVNGRNGFVPAPFWLQIPIDTTVRMRTDLSGYFPPPPSEFVIESERALLSVPKGWSGRVYLAGSFEVKDPPHEARSMRFEGSLSLPRILIFDGKRIVASSHH